MKRGQVSVFITVGIIILILGGVATYLIYKQNLDASNESSGRAFDNSIPSDVLPFKRYIEQCLDQVALQAVRAAGAQGGTIYPEAIGKTFDYMNPTESDGIQMFQSGGLKIPYWTYILGDNECTTGCVQAVTIPPLNGDSDVTVQSQMQKYVDDNIQNCIKNKEELEKIAIFYEPKGAPTTEVLFSSTNVQFTLNYPFEVQRGDQKIKVDKFASTVDVPFKDYYENAVYLAALVNNTQVLEKGTLSIISLYSGMDNAKLPPKAGSDNEFISTTTWVTEEVKKEVKQLLISTTPYYTVQNTLNFHPIDTFYDTSLYMLKNETQKNFILPNNENLNNYAVDFEYLGWEPYFELNDGAQVIQPETFRISWFPFFGINRERTMYQISYPVKITVSNPNDLDGKGFQFAFATEVNVRNNEPMNASYQPFNYSVFEEFVPQKTFLCDLDQKTSENVSFRVYNTKTLKAEPDVAMTFVCGEETCNIGRTNTDGTFKGPLPPCGGGRIELIKPDFEPIQIIVSPNVDFERKLGDIPFDPYRNVNVSVSRQKISKDVVNKVWNLGGTDQKDQNEEIIIQLKRINPPSQLIERDEYNAIAYLGKGETTTEMQILPGVYEGQITSILDQAVEFPPQEECIEYREFFDKKKECYYVPNETLVIDKYAGGAAYFNSNTSQIIITYDELDRSSNIEFKEIFVDIPSVAPINRFVEDLEQLGKLEEYSAQYADRIKPALS